MESQGVKRKFDSALAERDPARSTPANGGQRSTKRHQKAAAMSAEDDSAVNVTPNNPFQNPNQSPPAAQPRALPTTIALPHIAAPSASSNDEAKIMIGTLVLKNSRLKAENQRLQVEKEQLLRDREAEEAKAEDEVDEREASAATSTEQKKIEGLTKAKEKAVARWQCYKGQVKGAVKTISNLKNQVDYLETLLRFEERSRYSSMLSELQLE